MRLLQRIEDRLAAFIRRKAENAQRERAALAAFGYLLGDPEVIAQLGDLPAISSDSLFLATDELLGASREALYLIESEFSHFGETEPEARLMRRLSTAIAVAGDRLARAKQRAAQAA